MGWKLEVPLTRESVNHIEVKPGALLSVLFTLYHLIAAHLFDGFGVVAVNL